MSDSELGKNYVAAIKAGLEAATGTLASMLADLKQHQPVVDRLLAEARANPTVESVSRAATAMTEQGRYSIQVAACALDLFRTVVEIATASQKAATS